MADDNAAAVPLAVKTSDLPKRLASAVVMLAVAGAALFVGGVWLDAFIAIVAVATFVEFVLLTLKATSSAARRLVGIVAGLAYIGLATKSLIQAEGSLVFLIVGAVIAVDSSAYFAGRTFGGPKIAPSISPSKTWAGLIGGVVGASLATLGYYTFLYNNFVCQAYYDFWDSFEPARESTDFLILDHRCMIPEGTFGWELIWQSVVVGAVVAIAAQSGDFLESWLKRKAGVKDSSKLIPGHGGIFDRTDGLIAVAFLPAVVRAVQWAVG